MTRSEFSNLKYLTINKLEKIKENNYMRVSAPYGRFDPEMVDREIRRKRLNARAMLKKYGKVLEKRYEN